MAEQEIPGRLCRDPAADRFVHGLANHLQAGLRSGFLGKTDPGGEANPQSGAVPDPVSMPPRQPVVSK